MKPPVANSLSLPAGLRAYLDSVPTVTPEQLQGLEQAVKALADDTAFQADFYKSLFVNGVLDGMAKHSLSATEVSRRLGKTRQYVHRILTENKRTNFTIETMVELAMVVGKRFKLELTDAETSLATVRTEVTRRIPAAEQPAASIPAKVDFFSTSELSSESAADRDPFVARIFAGRNPKELPLAA